MDNIEVRNIVRWAHITLTEIRHSIKLYHVNGLGGHSKLQQRESEPGVIRTENDSYYNAVLNY
jgi:hypothetical protein